MSSNINLKLVLTLALALLGPAACNNQKAEVLEEEEAATESQSDASPSRDSRSSQSGDAAFIKIFPDGDVIPTRGESTTVAVPAAAATQATSESTSPAAETGTPAPAETAVTTPDDNTTSAPTQTPSTTSSEEPAAAETPAPTQQTASTETSQPAPAPIVLNEPAPAPASNEERAQAKDLDDSSRPVLTLNESTAAAIISVLPKENKAIVAIGKHHDFAPGAYMIQAKWTNDSKKVKVNVTSEEAKEKNCALDEAATQGEWKTLGVFYLTKNAKVVITNGKNSNYAVKNELHLKPVIAEHLTSPSKFKCLGGQIDGQGLVGFP